MLLARWVMGLVMVGMVQQLWVEAHVVSAVFTQVQCRAHHVYPRALHKGRPIQDLWGALATYQKNPNMKGPAATSSTASSLHIHHAKRLCTEKVGTELFPCGVGIFGSAKL